MAYAELLPKIEKIMEDGKAYTTAELHSEIYPSDDPERVKHIEHISRALRYLESMKSARFEWVNVGSIHTKSWVLV